MSYVKYVIMFNSEADVENHSGNIMDIFDAKDLAMVTDLSDLDFMVIPNKSDKIHMKRINHMVNLNMVLFNKKVIVGELYDFIIKNQSDFESDVGISFSGNYRGSVNGYILYNKSRDRIYTSVGGSRLFDMIFEFELQQKRIKSN